MRILKLNPFWLALFFSLVIEIVSTVVYNHLGMTYGVGTFTDLYCGFDRWVHWPALKMTQMFFSSRVWPGTGAHILFYCFSLCELWVILFVGIWAFRHFHRKSA
jgi:hypothetical protein